MSLHEQKIPNLGSHPFILCGYPTQFSYLSHSGWVGVVGGTPTVHIDSLVQM